MMVRLSMKAVMGDRDGDNDNNDDSVSDNDGFVFTKTNPTNERNLRTNERLPVY